MGLFSSIDQFLGRMVLRLIGLVFLLGGLLASHGGLTQLSTAWSARSWPSVQGEVVSSEVAGGRAAVLYRYDVGGQEHEGENIYVGDYSGIESHSQALVNSYPPGPVSVRYDPSDTASSVLEVRFPWTSLLLTGMGFTLLAAAVWLFRKKASFGEMAAQVADGL